MVAENVLLKNKGYAMVPPDGGWGYMICVAYVLIMVPNTMIFGSFGIIFNELFIKLHINSTSVSLISGIGLMSFSLAGYLTSPLQRLMSTRMTGFLASFLFNIGIFGAIFVNSRVLFFINQVIMSTGAGILFSIACTVMNEYFLKKRLLVTSTAQFISGFGALVMPLLIKWSLESLGFIGTIFMISGISLQTFVASALLQPVSWHMVKVETTSEEMVLLINKNISTDSKVTTPTITMTNTDEPFEAKIDIQSDTVLSIGNNKRSILKEFLDIGVLKKFFMSNASMGPAFCSFSDLFFLIMLPQALYASHWSEDLVAKALSLTSLGDLVTRVLFVFFSKWLTKFGNQEVFLVSVVLSLISRIGMHCTDNVTLSLIFITLIGVARCSTIILPPLILADVFGPVQFIKGLGIYMLVVGIMHLVFGPCIGAIRDMTNSYATAFYVVTSCYAVLVLLWSIELLYKKNKHKRIQQQITTEKLKSLNLKNKGK